MGARRCWTRSRRRGGRSTWRSTSSPTRSSCEALEDAQARGVDVRVILEEHPFGGGGGQEAIFARLEDAGIAVRWGNPVFRFTHIKTMIIDDAVAIIMNQNITASAFTATAISAW